MNKEFVAWNIFEFDSLSFSNLFNCHTLRLMSLEATELQGEEILYICNLKAHHPQIFRK